MCGPFAIAWLLISCFMLSLLAVIFWFWMLIDLLQRDTKDKLVWVIVILFLSVIGAILYYFMVYSRPKKRR